MNIAEVLEQALGQENDLNEKDRYVLHYQSQVLAQEHAIGLLRLFFQRALLPFFL